LRGSETPRFHSRFHFEQIPARLRSSNPSKQKGPTPSRNPSQRFEPSIAHGSAKIRTARCPARVDLRTHPLARLEAVQESRRRPMSERLELALSWNTLADELRAGLAGPPVPQAEPVTAAALPHSES
jgi:hypothetical protein